MDRPLDDVISDRQVINPIFEPVLSTYLLLGLTTLQRRGIRGERARRPNHWPRQDSRKVRPLASSMLTAIAQC